jgi:hypothetical protein
MQKPGVVPPTSPSPPPFPRYGHALPATATANGELYLFGGLVRETARNDLYLFSTRDLSATLVQTAGEIPSPRVGHASAIVSSVLIVWGGDTKTDPMSDPSDKQDDGLYLLNLGKRFCFTLYMSLRDDSLTSHVPNFDSFKGVDEGIDVRALPIRTIWARSNHGWNQVLRLRWSGGRGIFE